MKKKNYRMLQRDIARMIGWRKFMKAFKFYKPNPVPLKAMEKMMGW